jgi:hypothetical protein
MISQARSALFSSFFCADDLSSTSHRFDANTARRCRLSSLACKCETEEFHPLLFLVDNGAYARRVSLSARLFNQTWRLFRLFIPLPRLQVRVGAFLPHARSQTLAWCFFRTREALNVPLLRYVLAMGYLFNQTPRLFFFLAPPPSRDVCYSAHAEVKPLHVVLS